MHTISLPFSLSLFPPCPFPPPFRPSQSNSQQILFSMEAAIAQAAHCLQQGQHSEAELILEKLQSDESCQNLEAVLNTLNGNVTGPQGLFLHFVTLKLLRFCLIRNRDQWRTRRAETIQFLLNYAFGLDDNVLSGTWRPVVAEWALNVAVVLKLGCADDGGLPDAVVQGVCSLVSSAGGVASRRLLAWTVAQRTVEEFGLFDRASRYRGLPIPVHRLCRERFESAGQLSSIVCQIFVSLTQSDDCQETQSSLDAGVNALLTCLSWSGHRFFEEESSTEEGSDLFNVDDPQWDALLLSGLSTPHGATTRTQSLVSLIRSWWERGERSTGGGGAGVSPQLVSELLQQSCCFKGTHWNAAQHWQFLSDFMTLSLDCFTGIVGTETHCQGQESLYHCLPSVVGAMARLVATRQEVVVAEVAIPLVDRLQAATASLMKLEVQCDEDELIMSSLDEVLSAWYSLCGVALRGLARDSTGLGSVADGAAAHALRHISQCCSTLFHTYVQAKLSSEGESEQDTNAFAEAFSSSHLHFVAHLGRADAVAGGLTLSNALQYLNSRLNESAGTLDYCEQLWCVLKLVSFFIADPSEGEEPTIPFCFVQDASALSAVRGVLNTVVAWSALYTSAVQSPAVFAAYVEVMCNFVRVYADPEEPSDAFVSVFSCVRDDMIDFAMQLSVETLRRFPLDADVAKTVCDLLDALASTHRDARNALRSHAAYTALTEMVVQPVQHPLVGSTRGRLMAFLLMCAPSSATFQDVAHILCLFDVQTVRVDTVLELTYALSGVFQSLRRQDVLCTLFPFFSAIMQRLLEVAYAHFFEREIAIETVKLVRLIFTTSTPLVEDDRVRELLSTVLVTFRTCSTSLQTVPAWHAVDAESDRVELLIGLAHLIAGAAQWMKWDCYLPDSETAAFRTGSVECLAALFGFLNERSLALPELEEAAFVALKQCADSFPMELTFSVASNTFLAAILYSLHRGRVTIQRIGMDVATAVTSCLGAQSNSQENYTGTCREFLLTLLRGLASGGVYFANTRQLAGSILTVSRGVPQNLISECFGVVSAENVKSREVLESVFAALISTLCHGPNADAVIVTSFEDVLRDALSSLRGVSLL